MAGEFGDRIGAVVHGPEIVDSGNALRLINYLKKHGNVAAVLGGTMGRVAVIDAGLEGIITINPKRRPSISLRELAPTSDIIFLLSQAKSRETGLAFGSMVAAAAGIGKPLVQIDCGGRFVVDLSSEEDSGGDNSRGGGSGEDGLANQIALELGLDLLRPPPTHGISHLEDTIKRTLTGVNPGELISINGTVVARATGSRVEIEARDGRIVGITGADFKEHGLEKLHELHKVDLKDAIIRSGSIRRSLARPRLGAIGNKDGNKGAVFIDHCAEDAFEAARGASVAVTVGDDTTAVAADVLARLGIPVVGIVDGDLDRLAESLTMMPGSVIIRVEPGYDDLVGRRVLDEIFQGKKRISNSTADLAEKVKKLAGEHLIEIEQIKSDFS